MTAVPLEDAPFDIAGAWRRLRLPLVIAAILVGAAVLLAAFASNPASQPLDPRDASPQGALALSRLVSDQGVSVRVAADANGAASSGATVMVPTPAALTVTELRDISATAAVVVLVAPEQRELNALDLQVTPRSGTSGTLRPGCTLDAAVRAGDISYDGTLYAAPADVHCYPHDAGAGVVVHSTGSGSIVVVGSATLFANEELAHRGNAALALGLLTQRPTLVWLRPRPPTQPAADTASKGLVELLPDRLLWAAAALAICIVVIALWRARRLGPVVAEPLPVVVRAVETVEGRARLMRAAHARDEAGEALRAATQVRLSDLLSLGTSADAAAVVDAAARRTGRASTEVNEVLYGASPSDDGDLVQLANALDDLENAVRRT